MKSGKKFKMKFSKPAYPTVYFSEKIWVQCPKCAKHALVKTELPKYSVPFPLSYASSCNCSHCGYQESNKETWNGYFQGVVATGCGKCGNRVYHSTQPTKELFEFQKVTCGVCQSEREYEVQWYRYRNEKPTDPYFGFDLYLQANIKNNVLWLYNLEHLDYLKEYVEAKLREDDGRHKYSMITNLPKWIKSSKNRGTIVKKLNKLKQDFEKLA